MPDTALVVKNQETAQSIDLSKEIISTVVNSEPPAQEKSQRNVIRVTNSVAQYDVSKENPSSLQNIGKALAGSLDRDDFTYFDPETKSEVRLGDVLVAVDLTKPDEVVLTHRDSAGKGVLGRVMRSVQYMTENPVSTITMKAFGITADPEIIYKQKVIQALAQLDREGLFGQPGASTFNLHDWEIDTRAAWRDVVIRRAKDPEPMPSLSNAAFGAFKLSAA